MNYRQIHDTIIERAKIRKIEGYKERHHVIPRCLGGTNDLDNIVELTAKEHFLVHKLLCEIYPNDTKLFFAYRMMAFMKNSTDNERLYNVGCREFERIRLKSAEMIGNILRGRKYPKRDRRIIEKQLETRKKNGYRHSQETKMKISNALKNRKLSDDHISKLQKANQNNPKCTGKASTPEKEQIRRQKIKDSWVLRKQNKNL